MSFHKNNTCLDLKFIRLALRLARKGQGRVEPNPMVGCVIVKSGKIIAQGYHKKFGGPHAEIDALKKINFKAKGATMYVTLEPCCHFGKTPPCVDAVIKSGVARVVIGMKDPNPVVNGRAIRKLRKAGVAVTVGVCEEEAMRLNGEFCKSVILSKAKNPPVSRRSFALLRMTKDTQPYIIVKVAQSADGKIAARKGVRTQITGKQAFAYVQKLRASVDAILVGANTIRVDDPQLNVRDAKKKQPMRIVLSRSGKIDPKSRIFRAHGGDVIVIGCRGAVVAPEIVGGKTPPLRNIIEHLIAMRVSRLLVEGGAQIFSQFLKSNLVDEWHVITASVVIGKEGVSALQSLVASRWSLVKKLKKNGFVVKQTKMLGKDKLVIFKRRAAVSRLSCSDF